MTLEPDRMVAAASALAGGAFWGLFALTTSLLAGQPVSRSDVARAFANVACGLMAGALLGYFIAPALVALLPWPSLRDVHVVGFGTGALGWELAPILYRIAKARAGRVEREQGQ